MACFTCRCRIRKIRVWIAIWMLQVVKLGEACGYSHHFRERRWFGSPCIRQPGMASLAVNHVVKGDFTWLLYRFPVLKSGTGNGSFKSWKVRWREFVRLVGWTGIRFCQVPSFVVTMRGSHHLAVQSIPCYSEEFVPTTWTSPVSSIWFHLHVCPVASFRSFWKWFICQNETHFVSSNVTKAAGSERIIHPMHPCVDPSLLLLRAMAATVTITFPFTSGTFIFAWESRPIMHDVHGCMMWWMCKCRKEVRSKEFRRTRVT